MDFAPVFDYLLQVGVPAAMGLIILWYLLARIIPGQQETFKETLKSQQETFQKAVTDIICDSEKRTDQLSTLIRQENQTLVAILKYHRGPSGQLPPVENRPEGG